MFRDLSSVGGAPSGPALSILLAVSVFALAMPAMAAPRRALPMRADRVAIPAGPFVRGSTRAIDERPVETRRTRAYKIDRTEVTRAMYARCVAAGRCPAPPGVDLEADPSLPVTGVSWHDARAYCRFAGGRLPTEDEWEKAARGVDGREYPWGKEPDCARANWGNFDGEGPCAGKNPGRPVPVGQYAAGASPWGALDLAGNVWEWVEDAYEDDGEGATDEKAHAEGGKGGSKDGRRVVRGGSCCSYFVEPRASNRNGWAATHRDGDLGFRCVSR